MVVDAVAEEHSLSVCLELRPALASAVSLVVLKDVLEHLAHFKIVLAVLHPDDVTAIFCRFCEVVYILLLLERKVVPSRNLIPHDLEVCEFVDQELEVLVAGRFV